MIKEKEGLVRDILENYKATRDDDNKLVCLYWKTEMIKSGMDIHSNSTADMLRCMWEGRLSSTESITRCRRKLQELHPELRGEKYNKRHKELQAEVLDDLEEMSRNA